ncbi:N-acetylglucosamine-6-phosphate deacetylase [Ammoniphilus sp. CFH 90114]|uniref:N-acetylglucosamine-6-phosphate deacetylase n=1 Tax=Ammoniphilus sp. CFH 90114 TaxID=2493665 RepID=UPI00100E0A42|nr:N-acetylglucosamine-6-phosphate deacetylase [Ammoniphilus sp. CFH 90114]RXT04376.1 N-acetylglucosamine-6-phosphate deacetylase [Ammoniphilus sp. CFH 90114]
MKKRNWVLTGARIFGEQGQIEKGYIKLEDGLIAEMAGSSSLSDEALTEAVHLPENWSIIPGMIDLHIHGAAGADTMDANTEALVTMASALPAEGTTAFLATTMTQEEAIIELALRNVSLYMKEENDPGLAEVLGVHLEGPFISAKRAGAQPLDAIRLPDVELFKKWQALTDGQIRLVTLAPEQEGGLELTAYLRETGVVASVGHSDATYEEVVKAIEAGVTQATHLFNGMRGLHHREPGVVGAVLLHDEIMAEMIADGIHVRPEMIDMVYRQKGAKGLLLITDAMRAKCLGEGHYQLGGQDVEVSNGMATLRDGTLAGSVLKMRDAAVNMMEFTSCRLEEVIRMASENPARQLGVFNRKGSLLPGKDADVVVLDHEMKVRMTFCRGQLAFLQEEVEKDEMDSREG